MKSAGSKISVALCTFNGDKFLKRQLDSILQQHLAVNEIIICDDDSTDETISIVNEYKKRYPEIIYLHQNKPGLGAKKNFEKAIGLCTGEWIFLSDQDDIWMPDKTARMINIAESKKAQLLFTDALLIDENDKPTGKTLWETLNFTDRLQEKWNNTRYAVYQMAKGSNRVTGATVLFTSELKNKALPFPEFPQAYWHDSYLATIAASQNGLCLTKECLTNYRLHTGQQLGVGNGLFKKAGLKKAALLADQYLKSLSKHFPFSFLPVFLTSRLAVKFNYTYQGLPENGFIKKSYRKIFKGGQDFPSEDSYH